MCDDQGDARCGPGGGGGAAAVPAGGEELPERHFQSLCPAVQGHTHGLDYPVHIVIMCYGFFFCSNVTSHVPPLWIPAGKVVKHLSLSLFGDRFLGSEEHAGFLYVRSTLQSLQGLPLPNQPYLFGLLVHRAEVVWARAFPLRLMLRLGAEYRCKGGTSSNYSWVWDSLLVTPFVSCSSLPMPPVQCALQEAVVWGNRPHHNETAGGEFDICLSFRCTPNPP